MAVLYETGVGKVFIMLLEWAFFYSNIFLSKLAENFP